MSNYAGLLQRIASESAPWFIRNSHGRAFLESIGLTLDTITATLHRGLEQAQPLRCESASLPIIGADRGIRRYPTEPEASYRVRLARWRQIKKHAGSHYGQMISLAPYFLPGAIPRIRIAHQSNGVDQATWHTLEPDGSYRSETVQPSNFQWDIFPQAWSRFWVIVYIDTTIGPRPEAWDDGGKWDDGHIWDGYYTSNQIDDMISIINDSKAAHSKLAGLIFATDPASFDPQGGAGPGYPDGSWYQIVDPATNLPTRLASAIFAFDDGAP